MAGHNELGKKGEDAAVRYLRQKGYEILERNWVYERYEIDIIARDEEFIVFAEVKSRQHANLIAHDMGVDSIDRPGIPTLGSGDEKSGGLINQEQPPESRLDLKARKPK